MYQIDRLSPPSPEGNPSASTRLVYKEDQPLRSTEVDPRFSPAEGVAPPQQVAKLADSTLTHERPAVYIQQASILALDEPN